MYGIKIQTTLNKGGCDGGRVEGEHYFKLVRLSLDLKRCQVGVSSRDWQMLNIHKNNKKEILTCFYAILGNNWQIKMSYFILWAFAEFGEATEEAGNASLTLSLLLCSCMQLFWICFEATISLWFIHMFTLDVYIYLLLLFKDIPVFISI